MLGAKRAFHSKAFTNASPLTNLGMSFLQWHLTWLGEMPDLECWLQTTCLRAAGQDLLRNMPRLHADIPPGSAGEALDSEPDFNMQR